MIDKTFKRYDGTANGIKNYIALLMVVAVLSTIIVVPPSVYADDTAEYKEYSWSEVYNGALGTRPIINSITGEGEFLSSKEALLTERSTQRLMYQLRMRRPSGYCPRYIMIIRMTGLLQIMSDSEYP